MTPSALLIAAALIAGVLSPDLHAPGVVQVVATDETLAPLPVMVVYDCALAGHQVCRGLGSVEVVTSAADVCRVEAWAEGRREVWRVAPVGQGWVLGVWGLQ